MRSNWPTAEASAAPEVTREAPPDPPEPPAGRWYTTVAALVCAGIGGAATVASLRLGVGSLTDPGPGLWPLVLGVVILVLAGVLLVTAGRFDDAERFGGASRLPLMGAGTLVAFWVLLPLVGFEIPALLLMVFWLRVLGGESWRLSIVGGLLAVAAFYAVFVLALGVPIPRLI